MVGYADWNRAATMVTTMEQFSEMRWTRFLLTLELEERLEFGVGDIRLPGDLFGCCLLRSVCLVLPDLQVLLQTSARLMARITFSMVDVACDLRMYQVRWYHL